MPEPTNGERGDVADALRGLLKAGLDLGVAEASRRLAALTPPSSDRTKQPDLDSDAARVVVSEFIEAVKVDSAGVYQLVKEVWSRGDAKERRTAAHAIGHALGRLAPHRALGLSRELAGMARTPKEADVVGEEAIAPLLESNPPLFDRIKQFLGDNEVWVRRAAIAGLVGYATRRKKMAGVALEMILLVAEANEKEIRQAVRWAIRELSKVDWRATGVAITEWARQDPTGGRMKLAKQYASSAAVSARKEVEKFVITNLAKIANRATPAPAR
jgi:3-methyladenine DNA glycosylase AlkD